VRVLVLIFVQALRVEQEQAHEKVRAEERAALERERAALKGNGRGCLQEGDPET
jgi:hypothetical protein